LIFVVGGLGHFGQHEVMLARFDASPWSDAVRSLGDPLAFLYVSGAVMIVGGVMLAIGYKARLASLALFVALVPITFVIHIAPDHVGPLLKNVAILGALLHFFVAGAGRGSLDSRASA
jgi:putative oxidoreductase